MQKSRISSKLFFLIFIHCSALGQSFKIGTIDIYGNRKVDNNTILRYLKYKVGDSISHENFIPDELAMVLERVPGIKHASINPICCDTNKNIMLFVGVGETDSVILR